jgi:hypothetical protein
MKDYKLKLRNLLISHTLSWSVMSVYYESIKRKVKKKYICGCRCYERLQPNTKEFTRLAYTELVLELEHLKIETRLITKMFVNVMGECENEIR